MSYSESNEVTATGTAKTGNGILRGGLLAAGSGAAATAAIYDNTAASGTVIRTVAAPVGESAPLGLAPGGVHFGTGLHVVLTGAGAKLYLDI